MRFAVRRRLGANPFLIAAEQRREGGPRRQPWVWVLKIGAAKRRKKVLLDTTLSPLTGLLARPHGSPRLTPWATIFRHSVADSSLAGCPKLELRPRASARKKFVGKRGQGA